MGDGIRMERGTRRTGNTPRWNGNTQWQLRVDAVDELPNFDGRANPEDPIITALLSPTTMSHAQEYRDDEWAETSDALQGTAVFDATGDKAAMPSWDELVRQHADRVYRLAYRLSGNQHDAEDLTQETFIRVFRSVQNYQPGTFEGWLHRITTHLFLDMVRRRARIRMEALPEDYDRVPATSPTPSRSTTTRGSVPTCKQPWIRCRRSFVPRLFCVTSKVCPTRRSVPPWASSWAPCAAEFTAAVRRCATTWPHTPNTAPTPTAARGPIGHRLALHSISRR